MEAGEQLTVQLAGTDGKTSLCAESSSALWIGISQWDDKTGSCMGLDLGASLIRGPPEGIAHASSVLWELLKEMRTLLCIVMFQ